MASITRKNVGIIFAIIGGILFLTGLIAIIAYSYPSPSWPWILLVLGTVILLVVPFIVA